MKHHDPEARPARDAAARAIPLPARMLPAVFLAAACVTAAPAGAENRYFVDRANPACSDAGPGSATEPYCTIGAALAARQGPGTTIVVLPGEYREQVTLKVPGEPGRPLVLRAKPRPDAPVVIDGADDLGDPARWTRANGDVWVAASVDWTPRQVFVDDARLTPFTGSPDALPAGHFVHETGRGLFVHIGGGNPGDREVAVGRRPYGFYIARGAWQTVEGFTVVRAEDRGIQLTSGSSDVTVARNRVRHSGRFGIQAVGCSAVVLRANEVFDNGGHGIALTAGTRHALVERNHSHHNADPNVRVANGIYLYAATRNTLRSNNFHHNQDTGIQIQGGSSHNLTTQNVTWRNGDHGLDDLHASDNLHIGDVAFGNHKDGFSFEGDSPRNRIHNAIAIDNGTTTGSHNLMVDAGGSVGFQSDDNLFWNSSGQPPVRYQGTRYPSVRAYAAATGHDTRTIESDPRFADTERGDFRLRHGSPAIDNANSDVPSWPATDANGRKRVDDPSTANEGKGPVTFADRGAYEFPSRPRSAPVAAAGEDAGAPVRLGIAPNPLRGEGRITLALARPGPVSVAIYDMNGRAVRRIEHAAPAGGTVVLPLEPRDDGGSPLPPGIYFYQVHGGDGRQSGRFVVMR